MPNKCQQDSCVEEEEEYSKQGAWEEREKNRCKSSPYRSEKKNIFLPPPSVHLPICREFDDMPPQPPMLHSFLCLFSFRYRGKKRLRRRALNSPTPPMKQSRFEEMATPADTPLSSPKNDGFFFYISPGVPLCQTAASKHSRRESTADL